MASSSSRLVELTDIISTNTKKIDEYFAAEGLPKLTFDADGPPDFPVPNKNEEIAGARRAVVNATQELHDLMVGPRETIRWLAWSVGPFVSFKILHPTQSNPPLLCHTPQAAPL
jgi:hypothetical protein